jgi:hypothetical protein
MNFSLHLRPVFTAAILGLAAPMLAAATAQAPASPAPAPATASTPDAAKRATALFVYNRAGPTFDAKQAAFSDYLASRLSGAGFTLITPDVAATALETATRGGPPAPADQLLNNQTSALHLAQNLGAQYIFVAAIDSYAVDTRAFHGYNTDITNRIATLRVSYRLCDATQGGAIIGDIKTEEQVSPATSSIKNNDAGTLDQLLADAATDLAAAFKGSVTHEDIPAIAAAPKNVSFSVACSVADILIPDVVRTKDGDYVVGPPTYTLGLGAIDVTVALNGVVVGSAPGNLSGPPGLNTMSLSRVGFQDWQEMVALSPGFKLNVALQMDDTGRARWMETISFLQGLKTNAKLNDADVEKVKAAAQMLRQSGFRLDQRSDIQVNATQLPDVQEVNQSLFSTPPLPVAAPVKK